MQQQWPHLQITIEQICTKGDRITDLPLTQIGSDGVFVTELEHALQQKRIDLAVHSLKDLPTAQPPNLRIAVVGPREDPRDVLITQHPQQLSCHAAAELTLPLRIGTCSLRRTAQIRALRPDVQILPLRGNVDTRLHKLDAGQYDAIILAAAGLHRLTLQERLADRITYLPIDIMMPAPGQSALAVEMRDEPELQALIAPIHNATAHATTSAERTFMRRLGAGCYLPVAAHGTIIENRLTLHGLVISLGGQRQVRICQSIPWTSATTIEHAEQLGTQLAEQALALGAAEIIATMDRDRIEERQYV